jgi:hypothetical protein
MSITISFTGDVAWIDGKSTGEQGAGADHLGRAVGLRCLGGFDHDFRTVEFSPVSAPEVGTAWTSSSRLILLWESEVWGGEELAGGG